MNKILLLFLVFPVILFAEIPSNISWQGILTDDEGSRLNGTYEITLKLYNAETGGTALWTETQTIDIDNGHTNIILGESAALELPFNEQYWLELIIESGTPLSRVPLSSVPYALNVKNHAENSWSLEGNSGTNVTENFVGTLDSVDLNFRTNDELKAKITTKGQIEIYNTSQSILLGERAGENMTPGYMPSNNVFIGNRAGEDITTGYYNVGIGIEALKSAKWSSNNVAVGYHSLFNVKSGMDNSALGTFSLYRNKVGSRNIAIGKQALFENDSGDYNIAIGNAALYWSKSSSKNSAIGYKALFNNSGDMNVAIGHFALYRNNEADENTAVGSYALYRNNGKKRFGGSWIWSITQ